MGIAFLGLVGVLFGVAAVFLLMRLYWADDTLVSPILLDQVLDGDLRSLRRALQRRRDLSASERVLVGRLILEVAARQFEQSATASDLRRVRTARKLLRRRHRGSQALV